MRQINEQLLKMSGADVLSFRKKKKKSAGVKVDTSEGSIHSRPFSDNTGRKNGFAQVC